MVKRKKHKNSAINKYAKKTKTRSNKNIVDKVAMLFCGDVLT